MDEVILVDKPAGWTSFDVVAKIRGQLRAKLKAEGSPQKAKVGHSGTLDPFATGLLIILVGKATKRQDEFMKQDKVYEATFRLGATSTTGDPEGVIEERRAMNDERSRPREQQVKEALEKFTGEIEQMPPIYSAIKINGKKAYELARAGKPVELKPRKVHIYSLELTDYKWPELKITAHVSSGTYIRSLAVDIGDQLGTGAYCTQLRRTKIGQNDVNNAQTIDKISLNMLLKKI
ncbi:MAG: tRNA pseudouridine(55) synthase TruB [bacterium]|nr:tRNA pseudouridine(55) synthase TruB [bacterium]